MDTLQDFGVLFLMLGGPIVGYLIGYERGKKKKPLIFFWRK